MLITADIASGSGVPPATGWFDLQTSEFNSNSINGDTQDGSGYYIYTRTPFNAARLIFADEFEEISERVTLNCRSAEESTYSAAAIGAAGGQSGTVTISP